MARRRRPQQPTVRVQKTIVQVQYHPKLTFYDLLMAAAQSFVDDYPDWETTGLAVSLRNYDRHCSINIRHSGLSYEQDLGARDLEARNVGRMMQELPEALQLDEFTRVGFRQKYLIPTDMLFEDLVTVLDVKFRPQDSRLRGLLPERVTDVGFLIDAEDDSGKYHISIGPVHKKEMPKRLAYNEGQHLRPETRHEEHEQIVKDYPDVAVYADVDFYRAEEELSLETVRAFVDDARVRLETMTQALCQYIFEEQVRDNDLGTDYTSSRIH